MARGERGNSPNGLIVEGALRIVGRKSLSRGIV